MTFDLKTTPPTQAAIDQEREHITSVLAKLKRRLWMVSGATIVLSVLMSLWSLNTSLLTGEQVLRVFALAGIGAFTVAFTGVGAIALVVAIAAVAAFVGTVTFAFAGIGAFAFAVAGIGVETGTRLYNRLEKMQRNILQLTALESPENKHRCAAVLAACEKDTLCRNYAEDVARQGRSLILAEADLIMDWVADSTARVSREEKDRLQEIACSQLKHMHELHGEE
jgi:hypothetical protein